MSQPISKTKQGLSIFDLDNTLLNCTISFRFFCHLLIHRVYSFKNLYQVLCIGARYKLGVLSATKVHELAASLLLQSTSAKRLIFHFTEFSRRFSKKWINNKVLNVLFEARRRGHYILLATSSPDFLVIPLLKHFPVDEILASKYKVNRKTDRFHCSRPVDGRAKKEYTFRLSKKFNLPKQSLYAYSDSITDLPLLEAVGNPVVVSPDRKLKKIALIRRWERL